MGCLDPAIEDSMSDDIPAQGQPNANSTNSVTLQKMMQIKFSWTLSTHLTTN